MFTQRLILLIALWTAIDVSANYAIADIEAPCNENTIISTLILQHELSGAIGFDFVIQYDATKFLPTENFEILNQSVAEEFYDLSFFIQNDSSGLGTLNLSLFLSTGASSSHSWNSEINQAFLAIEFAKASPISTGEMNTFFIDEAIESFPTSFEVYSSNDPGTLLTLPNQELKGTLNYWMGYEPIAYNPAIPVQYAPTYITATDSFCQAIGSNTMLPELTGAFELNMNAANKLSISKDIANTQSVIDVINGFDAVLTMKVLLNDTTFLPNVFQLMAMDVNQDGAITAGDVSQINLRTILELGAFNQINGSHKDWVFIDKKTSEQNPGYQKSSHYPEPDSLGGFHKLNVPVVPQCIEPPAMAGCDFDFEVYLGILLGDVDGSWKDIEADGSLKTSQEVLQANVFIKEKNELILELFFHSEIESVDILWPNAEMIELNSQSETLFHAFNPLRKKRIDTMAFSHCSRKVNLSIKGDVPSILKNLTQLSIHINGEKHMLNPILKSTEF